MGSVLGQVFALITAACWAQNAVFYSLSGKRVSSGTTTHIRLWIAFPAMLLVHFIFFHNFFPTTGHINGFILLGISGLIGFFAADLLIFESFLLIGPRDTMIIMTLTPLFSALLSWMVLDEKLLFVHIFAILLTIGGIIWVVSEKTPDKEVNGKHKKIGVLIALGGALGQGLGIVFSKMGMDYGFHPISANNVRIAGGLIGLIIYAVVKGRFVEDFKKMEDKTSLSLIGVAALVGPVLGVVLSLYAVKIAPVGIVSTLMQTSPIFLLPVDRFFFKKKVTLRAVLGTIICIAGASLFFLF